MFQKRVVLALVAVPGILWASSNPFMFDKPRHEVEKPPKVELSKGVEQEPLVQKLNVSSASQEIIYQYDALGRIICVQDAIAGNRKFDYDAAGNRTHVSNLSCN